MLRSGSCTASISWTRSCTGGSFALGGCFLCRCALSEKIRLRHLDVSKCEDKAAAQRAKDAAAIPDAVGIDERLLTEQVRERLLRGESIEDLIRSEGDAL